MADLSTAISAMVVLLLVAAVGFVVAKVGYIDDHTFGKLCKMLLNVTLPCMIVASVAEMDAQAGRALVPWSFGLGFALYFGLLLLSWLCNVALRTPPHQRGAYLFMGTLTNLAFIGIPVATQLFGPSAAFVAGIFILCVNSVFYSVGILITTRGSTKGIDWRSMLNGPFVSCIIGLVLFFSGIALPNVVSSALSTIGGITAPLAMLLVGSIVSQANLREVAFEWRLYVISLLRQLVVPLALYVLLRPVFPNQELLGIFVVLFAMPVGTIVPMIAEGYGLDGTLPAKGTIISTVLSFATIPALLALLSIL